MPRDCVKRVELRFCLIELILSACWVFISVASIVAANWCVPSCKGIAMDKMTPMDGKSTMLVAGTRGSAAGMSCPPPTLTIQVSLATGFAAAVVSGLSFSPGGSQNAERSAISLATTSGGHFNPAVTLGLVARFYMRPHRLVTYILAQLLGAMIAAALLLVAIGGACFVDAYQAVPTSTLPVGSCVLLEAILTMLIVLVHLWAHEKALFMGTPILIGFAYVAASLIGTIMLSNHVPNPLRSFGLAVVGVGSWGQVGVDSVGALCGSLAAALVDMVVFEERIWMPEIITGDSDSDDHASRSDEVDM